MLEKGDLVTLSNNKEYLVVEEINFEQKDYIILTSKDGISGLYICLKENDELTIIKDEELIKKLLKIFSELNGDNNE